MQSSEQAELVERAQRCDRVLFAEREPQLGAEARTRDRRQSARRDRLLRQRRRARLERETEARAIARQAQQSRWVIEKALLVQHAQAPVAQVFERVRRRAKLRTSHAAERQRDRVDREVTPPQILLERAGANLGQRAGRRVGLGAPLRDVDPAALPGDDGRAEPLVALDAATRSVVRRELRVDERRDPRREGVGGAVDHDVELARAALQQ